MKLDMYCSTGVFSGIILYHLYNFNNVRVPLLISLQDNKLFINLLEQILRELNFSGYLL